MNPLVSVSIITYQHVRFIRECLESVYAQQTDFQFEVLIGEDDSTDGTREICIEFAERYPEITRLYLHDRGNRTILDPRAPWRQNFLNNLRSTRGRYIALLDGDDFWTDRLKLQKQIDVLRSDDSIAGSFHDCLILEDGSGDERFRIGSRVIDSRVDLGSLIKENNIPTSSMVFHNKVDWFDLPSWFFRTPKGDYGIALLVAQTGDWCFVGGVMSAYRRHRGGIWTGSLGDFRFNENLRFWNLLAQSGEFDRYKSLINGRRKELLRAHGIELGRRGEISSALRTFIQGFDWRESKKIIAQVIRKDFLLASGKGLLGLNRKRNGASSSQ